MEFGCCVARDQLTALAAAGADYAELSIAGTVMAGEGDGDSAALSAQLGALGVKPRAYNVLLPARLPVVGPAVDRDALATYLRTAFDRARRLGGTTVVFGSGRARSVPDGFAREAALDQLAAFLRRVGDLAADHGLTIALEPLRRAESNVVNSLAEGAAFIRDRGLDGVRLLADLYHMTEEDEPLTAIDGVADLLAHAHVADRGRHPPGTGDYPLVAFLARLRAAGYRGDCSIECTWTDFSGQAGPSLAHLRGAARAAGW